MTQTDMSKPNYRKGRGDECCVISFVSAINFAFCGTHSCPIRKAESNFQLKTRHKCKGDNDLLARKILVMFSPKQEA